MSALSRRSLVTTAAALPALAAAAAIPAIASPVPHTVAAIQAAPDPIFAALAAHRRSVAQYNRLSNRYDLAGGYAWDKKPGLSELEAKIDRASKAETEAAWALTKIKPTTPAGAGALIAFLWRDIQHGDTKWHSPAFANAIRALRDMGKPEPQIAREAVQS